MRSLKQAVYSSRTADKFVVRLPDGMRERIQEVAKSHHRSMNSEIIARLDRSLGAPDETDGSVEIQAPEGTVWNPSMGMLVRTPDGIGSIQGIRYSDKAMQTVQIEVDHLWYNLGDIKPIWLMA